MSIDPHKYLLNMLKVIVKYANIHLQYLANEFENKYPNKPIRITIPTKRVKNIIEKSTKELMRTLEWTAMSKKELGNTLIYLSFYVNNIKNIIVLGIQEHNVAYDFAFNEFPYSKFHICENWEFHICELTESVIKNMYDKYVAKK